MNSYDVTSSFVQVVDAGPREAREVLTQIDPMRSLADRLSALGLDDRAMWAEGCDELTYRLVWRFGPKGGNAMIDWRFAVSADATGRATLTLKFAARGSDAAARSRVLASWTLLEELAQSHARSLAHTVEEYANEDEFASEWDWPQLRAVV